MNLPIHRGERSPINEANGLDRADAPELSQPGPLALVEARKCPVAIDLLRDARSDRLRLVAHPFTG